MFIFKFINDKIWNTFRGVAICSGARSQSKTEGHGRILPAIPQVYFIRTEQETVKQVSIGISDKAYQEE